MNDAFERAFSEGARKEDSPMMQHLEPKHILSGVGIVMGEMERDFDAKIATLQKQIDELRRALVADGVEHEREAEAMSVGAAVSRDIYGRHP